MPSRVTVLPATTQAGKQTIRFLLESESKPTVRGIYRDPSKAPAEFTGNPRFEVAQGDVGAGPSLDFESSDAVFYVPPPTYDGMDHEAWATQTATNVANALKRSSSVKRLVLHSAPGAQNESGIGILVLNHISDRILQAAAPEVVIVRPAYYYQMWADNVKTMQGNPPTMESFISPGDWKIPMVSTKDIGEYCSKALLDPSAKPGLQTFKLFGPRLYSFLDVKEAIESITGKKGELVAIPPEKLPGYWAERVPKEYVEEFVEFTKAQLEGGILARDYEYGEDTIRGKRELIDDLREMAPQ